MTTIEEDQFIDKAYNAIKVLAIEKLHPAIEIDRQRIESSVKKILRNLVEDVKQSK